MKSEAEGREFAKVLRSLLRTICSISERTEQFLVTECFSNLFLEVYNKINNKLEQLEFKQKKILGFRNMQEKLEKK